MPWVTAQFVFAVALAFDAAGVDTYFIFTDLALFAINGGTILGPTGSIGTNKKFRAFHPSTIFINALSQITNLPIWALYLIAGCRITIPVGASLVFWTFDSHTTSLLAFGIGTDLPISLAKNGLAIFWITFSIGTSVLLRTGHIHTVFRCALFFDTNFTLARADSSGTVFRITKPIYAHHSRFTGLFRMTICLHAAPRYTYIIAVNAIQVDLAVSYHRVL